MEIFFFLFALLLVSSTKAVELQPASCYDCLETQKAQVYCLYTYVNGSDTLGAFAVCHNENITECEPVGTLKTAVEGEGITAVVEVREGPACQGDEGSPSANDLETTAYIVPMDAVDKTEHELGKIVECLACLNTIVGGSQGWCMYEGGGYCGYPTTDGDGVCKALGGIPKDGELMTECPVEPTSSSTVAEIYPSDDVTPSGASSYCASTSFILVLTHLFCIL